MGKSSWHHFVIHFGGVHADVSRIQAKAQDTERVKRAARWNAEATVEAQICSPRWVNRTSTRNEDLSSLSLTLRGSVKDFTAIGCIKSGTESAAVIYESRCQSL